MSFFDKNVSFFFNLIRKPFISIKSETLKKKADKEKERERKNDKTIQT